MVRGWNVMSGYLDRPGDTAMTLDAEGWLRTGDLGQMTEDGRLIFVGRLKDIVRVGGENVAPADVENTLHSHPKILQAQVVGVPDRRLVEVVAAFVVLNPGATATPDEIIAWCATQMAAFKVPRYVEIVPSFEEIGMTASSKVQKNRLAEHAIRILGLEDATAR
jgi:fatty-acyl-CoA synthase